MTDPAPAELASLTYLPWCRPSEWDERPCVADERLQLTYAEFGERVDAAAEQFADHGVGAGDVVAVMLPNRVELLISLVAAWRLGAGATPVNPAFTADEADHQILDAGSVLVVNAGDGAPDGGRPSIGVEELRSVSRGRELPEPPTDVNALALLIYTSGSTGRPKGVMLDHAHISSMAEMIADAGALTGDDHCLLVLPLFHSNAINASFLAMARAGGRLTILAKFHPVSFLEAIAQFRPSYFSAVPTIYSHMVSLPEEMQFDTSSVRFAFCGAAPASVQLLEGAEKRFGFPLVEGYGLTEGTCVSTLNPVDGPRKIGTVGVPLPGQRVEIMAPDGTIMPRGERGEVVIQGPNVMRGYLNRPDATAESLGDGWLHTGDVGILDEDGYLRLVDRIKDMIIRGGENLYPKEIEAELHAHPAVLEAAVVGAPHDVLGEVPVAYVSTRPGTSVTEEELKELCAAHLTRVKVPVAITVLDALPKNPVGKIDKPTLRQRTAPISVKGS
ncbi:acyl-CoA synthetase (AMP-forming)/AMP-acid ligase II [Nocardioides sp. BE266]|uniref:class I adenylate-forming enzyme family protein n=1 Tax=Nocardioides sp. BE266 TaxID=2817725 RepID=UPI0028564423|nr:AMP-binding protein [Nocardioides sp. BE266]MDR7252387.1 acyl-CoA synthetase (AMP-forming)/AMP-acid ligase II [Nocardioides sp. BE266]